VSLSVGRSSKYERGALRYARGRGRGRHGELLRARKKRLVEYERLLAFNGDALRTRRQRGVKRLRNLLQRRAVAGVGEPAFPRARALGGATAMETVATARVEPTVFEPVRATLV